MSKRAEDHQTTALAALHDEQARRLSRLAGVGCGLIYCLGYALAVWGYDARVLARSSAELAWAKLAVGLPSLLLISAATGALAGRSDRAGAWVGAWMVSGVLSGTVAGGMPFAGYNLATWIAEPHLWGTNVYPMGPAGATRTVFLAVVTGCAGSALGLVGYALMDSVRGRAAATGRAGGRSWAVLMLCLPLAMPPGLIGDQIINRPIRAGQRTVHQAISVGLVGDTSDRDSRLLSASYTLHLVSRPLETQEQETVDVAFDNGFVVRCQVSDHALVECPPISPRFEAWMDALIQEALRGGQETELTPQAGRVSVDESTWSWLASQRTYMGERYEIARETQRGGWVIMSARFDTGYTLTCDFHGVSSVVVDRCSGHQVTQG